MVVILETVAARPEGVTLSALARMVGIPKSTVHTLTQGLLATDYLYERAGLLFLGPGIELLTMPLGDHPLERLAHDELERLAADTGETAQLAVRSGDNLVVIDQVESAQEIRYAVPLRSRRPLLTTSMGKLFLADLGADELTSFLKERGELATPSGKTILAERDTIRESGVAFNLEESVAGVCAAGAAVRGASGKVVAALVVAGPAARIRPQAEAIAARLRKTAERLSDRLARG
ncbi:IclR family transcriptional regulator [Nonomuraea longispora]|uniref:IclR family transcriptional regulator n=1 Tax=Nonomuraea longispora TaxID=1848320 RepID=A0A4V2XHY4_9ACTN|nr:IclR family transcriptional regulator [Nonomuraea longispora]TDB96735.1 IclR family transcriptional regulator [Nonomuraea longispora]